MILPWRPVSPVAGDLPISTSLTEKETARLRELAADRFVLEVGAAYGFSTVVLASVAVRVVSIDPHIALNSFETWKHNLEHYRVANGVRGIVESSKVALPSLIEGYAGTFDFIFIDGDHSAAAVEFDITNAKKLLRPRGWLALHDYNETTCPDVKPVCDRLLPGGELTDTLWVAQMG